MQSDCIYLTVSLLYMGINLLCKSYVHARRAFGVSRYDSTTRSSVGSRTALVSLTFVEEQYGFMRTAEHYGIS